MIFKGWAMPGHEWDIFRFFQKNPKNLLQLTFVDLNF